MAANPITLPTQQISIEGTSPDPDAVEIDKDGSIQFTSSDECTIEWQDEHGNKGTFWSPQPGTVTQGVNPVQYALPSANHHTLTYALALKSTAEERIEAQGGGTIKVGS